jgi:hypothetical protein
MKKESQRLTLELLLASVGITTDAVSSTPIQKD